VDFDEDQFERSLLAELVKSDDREMRQRLGRFISQILKPQLAPYQHDYPQSYVKDVTGQLRSDGYVPLHGFDSIEAIKSVAEAAPAIPADYSLMPDAFIETDYPLRDPPPDAMCGESSSATAIATPGVLELILHPLVLKSVQEYLGVTPTIVSTTIRRIYPQGETRGHLQTWHSDRSGFKFCKLFVSLSDVDDDCGPHEYARKTHDIVAWRKDAENASSYEAINSRKLTDQEFGRHFSNCGVATRTGPVGTSSIEDTAGFNRSRPLATKSRTDLVTLYSATPKYGFDWERTSFASLPEEVRNQIPDFHDNPVMQYINRLMLTA